MLFGTYDPKKVIVTVGTIVVVGYTDGTMVKCYRNEDAFSIKVGGDGNATRIKNANRSGRVELTLDHSSPTNDQLQAQAIVDEQSGAGVVPTLVKDASSTISRAQGANSWIVKNADFERAKELGSLTWIIETDFLDLSVGGTLPIAT